MKNKETLIRKAQKINKEVQEFCEKNSYSIENLDLKLTYSPWDGGKYFYHLQTNKNCNTQFTIEQLQNLKTFLNSIELVE